MPVRKLRVRKPVIAAIVATGAIASTGLAVQQTAMAGTNGQHITFCTDHDAKSVEVSGRNQDGAATIVPFDLVANRQPNGCVPYDPNYWWKGWVHLTWTFGDGQRSESDCFAPEVNDPGQANPDFVICMDAPPGASPSEPTSAQQGPPPAP
jgi:hypothetical protein